MQRTFRAVLLAGLLVAPSLSAQAATKIALGYTAVPIYAGAFVAKDRGIFEKHGLDVDLIFITLNSTLPSALLGGVLQIAGPTPSVLLEANEAGLDLAVLANTARNDPMDEAVVARTGLAIRSARDLVGKKVGVPGLGAFLHVLFRQWLTSKGVDFTQVSFVEVAFLQMSEALHSGAVDAVVTAGPVLDRLVAEKTGYMVSLFTSDLPADLVTAVYASTGEWARAHPDAVKAFQDSIAEADDFAAKNPDATRKIIGKVMKLPALALATIRLPLLEAKISAPQLGFWAEVMAKQEMLKGRPDVAGMIVK